MVRKGSPVRVRWRASPEPRAHHIRGARLITRIIALSLQRLGGGPTTRTMRLERSAFRTAADVVRNLAVIGVVLAIGGLGALVVWATHVTQRHGEAIASAGAQTAGHLRALQALGQID